MEEKAVRSIPWVFLSYVAKKLVTLSTTVVLARLLEPSDFGVLAASAVAIGALTGFSDLGVGSVFVVRKEMTADQRRTVLGFLVVSSAALSLVLIAAAPLIAGFFGDVRLVAVLRVLLLMELFTGFTWFYENQLKRELEFRKQFGCEIAQTAVLSVTSISAAAAGLGYWAGVAGIIAGWGAYTVAQLAVAPQRVRPGLQWRLVRDLVRNGRGFVVRGSVGFLQTNVDYVTVGRILGPRMLGYYSMSYRVAEQGYWAISDVVGRVAFPAFARMRHRGEDVAAAFTRTLRVIALLSIPSGLLLSALARPLTLAVLGRQWLPAVAPLAALGLWAAARPVHHAMSWFLASQDRAGLQATGSLALLVLQVPALVLAARGGGIVAVAWVMVAHSAASVVVFGLVLRRWMGCSLRRLAGSVRSGLVAGAAAWVVARIASGPDALPPALALAAGAAAGASTAVGLVCILEPEVVSLARDRLRGRGRQDVATA